MGEGEHQMAGSLRDPGVLAAIHAARRPSADTAGPFASPADWRDGWIYFLMVDRFNNPDRAPWHQPYDDPGYAGFQGGTFRGVQAQLGYIKDLGASAIWISPALKNLGWDTGSYHGYGIHDFLAAEPRFATSAATADTELRDLVDAAHAVGLWVIFDIVLNHVGNAFAYSPGDPGTVQGATFSPVPLPAYWRLPDGTPRPAPDPIEQITGSPGSDLVWPSELQQNAYFRRQGNPQAGGDDTVGDFVTLRQMRTDNPGVQDALIAAYQYVMARFDPDGFRIDTLRYLKGDLPRQFGNAVREFAESLGKRNFFTFGEVLDNTAENDIARFIGRDTLDLANQQLVGVDAALDYPLFFALKPVVKGLAAPTSVIAMYDQRKTVEADIVSSHGDATRFFVTFLDNHDMKERIRYEAPGNPTEFDDQVTLGLASLFALPGIPCVYYGTEQGLHGAGSDPAVREAIWGLTGFPVTGPFYLALQKLSALRNAEPALRYGRHYFRQVSGDQVHFGFSPDNGGVLAWSRILADQERTIIANTSTTTPQNLSVIVDATLAGTSAPQVLYSNKAAPIIPGPVTALPDAIVTQDDGTTTIGAVTVPVSLHPMEIQILSC
jgi:glycosidase